MDQQQLRELEYRCIQEQPAWCVADCPLHVDARAFLAHAAKGEWRAARKILERTMPFPGILGRVCDHPCQDRCKRGEVGGAIAVAEVERACVGLADQQTRPLLLPQKSKRVAVLGGGLAGMTAAWDLARKGWAVTLCMAGDQAGGSLLGLPGERIPAGEFAKAMDLLSRAKVEVRAREKLDRALLDQVLADHEAVFLDLDEARLADMSLAGEPDPMTLSLNVDAGGGPRIFAGGGPGPGGAYSPMRQAEDGRRAGSSLDRLLQGASLTAERGKEGPYETRLYTEIRDVEPVPVTSMQGGASGYSEAEAMREAARCLQCECLECVKACVYLQHYKGYPKTYARQVYNNAAIVKGHHQSNKFINSCALCGQCAVICPNDFSMAELCLDSRESMVQRGKMPPSAYDFALEDLKFSRGEHFSLARPAPGGKATTFAFFPGCQLAASNPEQVEAAYAWLLDALDGEVGLVLGCCGAPAHWAGEEALFAEVLEELRGLHKGVGAPTLITACATCHDMFSRLAPDLPTRTVWEVLQEAEALPGPGARDQNAPMALHDPCTSRRYAAQQDMVRQVLAKLGVGVEELDYSRELTSCCGYGGLMSCANPDLARDVAASRCAESGNDYLAWCAMCRDMFARQGKRASHVLDLLFPTGRGDPAARPSPGFSERCENRARLKNEMLRTHWREDPVSKEAYEAVALHVSDEVRTLLEERRILTRDVQRVIHHAEQTGRCLSNPATGRFLAYHQPVRVTFWVEYEPEDGGFRVHGAYSHRMVLPGAKP